MCTVYRLYICWTCIDVGHVYMSYVGHVYVLDMYMLNMYISWACRYLEHVDILNMYIF